MSVKFPGTASVTGTVDPHQVDQEVADFRSTLKDQDIPTLLGAYQKLAQGDALSKAKSEEVLQELTGRGSDALKTARGTLKGDKAATHVLDKLLKSPSWAGDAGGGKKAPPPSMSVEERKDLARASAERQFPDNQVAQKLAEKEYLGTISPGERTSLDGVRSVSRDLALLRTGTMDRGTATFIADNIREAVGNGKVDWKTLGVDDQGLQGLVTQVLAREAGRYLQQLKSGATTDSGYANFAANQVRQAVKEGATSLKSLGTDEAELQKLVGQARGRDAAKDLATLRTADGGYAPVLAKDIRAAVKDGVADWKTLGVDDAGLTQLVNDANVRDAQRNLTSLRTEKLDPGFAQLKALLVRNAVSSGVVDWKTLGTDEKELTSLVDKAVASGAQDDLATLRSGKVDQTLAPFLGRRIAQAVDDKATDWKTLGVTPEELKKLVDAAPDRGAPMTHQKMMILNDGFLGRSTFTNAEGVGVSIHDSLGDEYSKIWAETQDKLSAARALLPGTQMTSKAPSYTFGLERLNDSKVRVQLERHAADPLGLSVRNRDDSKTVYELDLSQPEGQHAFQQMMTPEFRKRVEAGLQKGLSFSDSVAIALRNRDVAPVLREDVRSTVRSTDVQLGPLKDPP
jgi:hypothetical protein